MTYEYLTAQQIITKARNEAISSSTSNITALQDSDMVEFIHQLNSDFVFEAHVQHHAKGWSWMKKPSNFQTVSNNALASAISAGASTFALNDASNFGSSGRVAIETSRNAIDIVDYSSKSTNTLTVDTDGEQISIDHSTDKVHKLYAVPNDFGRVHRLWMNSVEYDEEERTGKFPYGNRYQLVGDYFMLPRGVATLDATLLYEKKPNDITSIDSETNIPRAFQRWAIEMTLFRLFRIRRKRGDLETTDALAQRELEKALNYDATQSTSNTIRLARN